MTEKLILSPKHRSTHTYVIGQSGTGKSRAMESWIMQDILSGHGVGVIDPHGDLVNNIVMRLVGYPSVWERIVLVNPFDENWSIGINPLERIHGLPLERTSAFMTDVMMKIWGLNTTNAPRMLWLVMNTFLALSDLGLTLLDIPRFLHDKHYRNDLLPSISFSRVREYFQNEFPTDRETIIQWTSPALNKIGALIFDPDIRPMLAGGQTLNLREVMDQEQVLLVNLSKGLLGEAASSLVGAFILARLQNVALSRVDTQRRLPFYLYLDEFQNYTTDNIKDILTESRKYGLSMTFAHQFLDQIPEEILSAVINTAGTIVSFRVGFQDAQILAREIFPNSKFKEQDANNLAMKLDGVWPKLEIERRREPANWDHQAHLLTSLKLREFWVKRRGVLAPSKHLSHFMPNVKTTPAKKIMRKMLIDKSGKTYGRNKQAIISQIEKQRVEVSPQMKDVPLWES